MTVGEGKFLLYTYIAPALKAGDYRFDATQDLTAKQGTQTLDHDTLKAETLSTHVRVTAPRFQLPPDQVLSTYPPAGTEGSYGARLPQVVIKRRTLPWERGLTVPDADPNKPPKKLPDTTPWLALVLIAEGEAELKLNQDVAKCVSPDVKLEGEVDVAKGNCLVVRQSILEKVLPTQKDIPLLAHAREVDIHDTELMMGDDDGFLAVVIANRLPVPGVDAKGQPAPVKYMACLINLEGQFHRLIPQAPPPVDHTKHLDYLGDLYVQPAVFDHIAGGGLAEHWADPVVNPALGNIGNIAFGGQLDESIHDDAPDAPHADGDAPRADGDAVSLGIQMQTTIKPDGTGLSAYTSQKGYVANKGVDIYAKMADDFAKVNYQIFEPEFTFPVLLHWSFISTGNVTFESLMEGLDSGLLGTVPEQPQDETGRPPLEVVETGHVGLTHRTRRGDTVRTWYRGPLLAHPSSGERLPIAHASDQLRAVIPDGREDLSLAAAFEVGRLLALSRPSMVASLLRWRQTHFQAARGQSVWEGLLDQLPFGDIVLTHDIRKQLEGRLRTLITTNPDDLIGPPRVLIGAGDPVDWGANPLEVLGKGFGLDVDLTKNLRTMQDLTAVATQLQHITPPVITPGTLTDVLGSAGIAGHLQQLLDVSTEQLVSNVLANEIAIDPVLGATAVRTPVVGAVIPTGHIDTGIVNLPGGILDTTTIAGTIGIGGFGNVGPVLHPGSEPAKRRTRKPKSPNRAERVPDRPDPLDEVLSPRTKRTRKDRS